MNNEKIELLSKLRTVKMDERCTPNERQNANVLYEKLLNKYHLTDDDIKEEPRQLYWFRYENSFEKELLAQIYGHLTNRGKITYVQSTKRRNKIAFQLTEKQERTLHRQYESFRLDLKKGLKLYFMAFLQTNNLVIKTDDKLEDLTDEEMDEIILIIKMARSIKPTPMIEKRTDHLLEDKS